MSFLQKKIILCYENVHDPIACSIIMNNLFGKYIFMFITV